MMSDAGYGPRKYQKPIVVPDDLQLLAGPTDGTIRLPVHLDWSPNPVYDLDAPGRIIDLYRTVINDASSPEDLHTFLNKKMLKRLWTYMWLAVPVRRAWESRFQELGQLSQLVAA